MVHVIGCTNAGGGVRLPVEAIVELDTGDFVLALHLVSRVTLEHDGVTRLPAVTITTTVQGCSRVVTGCCRGSWSHKAMSRYIRIQAVHAEIILHSLL